MWRVLLLLIVILAALVLWWHNRPSSARPQQTTIGGGATLGSHDGGGTTLGGYGGGGTTLGGHGGGFPGINDPDAIVINEDTGSPIVRGGGARHAHHSSTMYDYVKTLDEHDRIGGTAGHIGGAAGIDNAIEPKKHPPAKKPWAEYTTWTELMKDEGATHDYFLQRSAAINNPNLDWTPVLAEVNPKLAENREYIGVVNLDDDGKTLHLTQMEASPIIAGEMESDTAFAAVPAELVAKHAARPGLFLFHTHPADLRGSPLPSSTDLVCAIYFGATSRYAGNAVISRYGVFTYGLDWSSHTAIENAHDWKLALLNYSHDIAAAHESIRSWSKFNLTDYLNFYSRHRLFINSHPSPEMIGDRRQYSFLWNIERPIDYELIADQSRQIAEHRKKHPPPPSNITTSNKSTLPHDFNNYDYTHGIVHEFTHGVNDNELRYGFDLHHKESK